MSILNVNKINPVGGGSTITIAGIASVTNNVLVGDSNLHSTGLALGVGSTVGAVTGVTTYYGDGSQLTGISVDSTKIETGTTKIQTSATLITNQVSGAGIATVQAGGMDVTGIVTATNVSVGSSVTAATFFGNGAGLTNVSAGKVLQVQYKRGGVTTSSNSGGWTDSVESGLNVDITPTSSTSFIIVQMHSVGGNTSSGRSYFLRLRRKINNTGDTGVASFQIGDGSNGGMQSLALTHVEVPNNWNTSHAINYRIRFGQDGSGTARFDYATTSVLYAMEVQP